MKLWLNLAIFLFLIELGCAQNFANEIYFKSFGCTVSDESAVRDVYPNISCNVNFINRKVSTLNVYVLLRRPLVKFYVSLEKLVGKKWIEQFLFQIFAQVFYKESEKFVEKFHTPVMEICSLIKYSTSNILMQDSLRVFQANFREIFHEWVTKIKFYFNFFQFFFFRCPYTGVSW